MRLIDGHLDLAYLALNGRDLRQPLDTDSPGCVTMPALKAGGVAIAFATIFTEPTNKPAAEMLPEMYRAGHAESAEAAGMRQLKVYEQLEMEGAISIVRELEDLSDDDSRLKAVLLMEGADPIRSPQDVKRWHKRGLRIVGLTWAAGTRYAGGNGPPPGKTPPPFYNTGSLTPEGHDMISALDEVGIIHDVSHLSDAAFESLMAHARGQVIASHSNCRTLVENWQRHLRDDQIKSIADRGGVIGLNLFSRFLAKDRRATISDCVRHLEHVCEIAGHRRAVALGSDADGGFDKNDLPTELDHPAKWTRLLNELKHVGWSETEIAAFAHGNWMRILQTGLAD